MCIAFFSRWIHRSGNNLVALINLIHYSFHVKKYRKFQVPTHPLFHICCNTNDEDDCCECDTTYDLTNRINPCGIGFTLSIDDMKRIFKKYLSMKIQSSSVYSDIAVHIRSGDLFGHCPHGLYVQPPFQFYKEIIERNSNKTIIFVYENTSNPVIKMLMDNCEPLSNVSFQSSTLENDILTLSHCKCLVFGVGSFCVIPFVISDTIKEIIFPERGLQMGHYGIPKETSYHMPTLNHYMNSWHNTEEQKQKMITYELSEEDKIKCTMNT